MNALFRWEGCNMSPDGIILNRHTHTFPTGPWRRGDGAAGGVEDGQRLPEDGRVAAVPALPDRPRLHPHGLRRPLQGHQDVVRRAPRRSRPRPGLFCLFLYM